VTGPTLLVASAGGHINELYEFADRLEPDPASRVWITSSSPQTQSLLASEQVEWVPAVGSRQAVKALSTLPQAMGLVRRLAPRKMVSTGAALAVPYLVVSRLARIPSLYIESATRLDGPSVTGRLVEWLPGMELRHQGEDWVRRRWRPTSSVFDGYRACDLPARADGPLRVVVTFGTEQFPFTRAAEAIGAAIPEGSEVIWQLGHTPTPASAQGTVHTWMSYETLLRASAAADVVITHAGVGSVLTSLRAGKIPVVLPRNADYGEHVDNHQIKLAARLSDMGLASVANPDADEIRRQFPAAIQRGAACSEDDHSC